MSFDTARFLKEHGLYPRLFVSTVPVPIGLLPYFPPLGEDLSESFFMNFDDLYYGGHYSLLTFLRSYAFLLTLPNGRLLPYLHFLKILKKKMPLIETLLEKRQWQETISHEDLFDPISFFTFKELSFVTFVYGIEDTGVYRRSGKEELRKLKSLFFPKKEKRPAPHDISVIKNVLASLDFEEDGPFSRGGRDGNDDPFFVALGEDEKIPSFENMFKVSELFFQKRLSLEDTPEDSFVVKSDFPLGGKIKIFGACLWGEGYEPNNFSDSFVLGVLDHYTAFPDPGKIEALMLKTAIDVGLHLFLSAQTLHSERSFLEALSLASLLGDDSEVLNVPFSRDEGFVSALERFKRVTERVIGDRWLDLIRQRLRTQAFAVTGLPGSVRFKDAFLGCSGKEVPLSEGLKEDGRFFSLALSFFLHRAFADRQFVSLGCIKDWRPVRWLQEIDTRRDLGIIVPQGKRKVPRCCALACRELLEQYLAGTPVLSHLYRVPCSLDYFYKKKTEEENEEVGEKKVFLSPISLPIGNTPLELFFPSFLPLVTDVEPENCSVMLRGIRKRLERLQQKELEKDVRPEALSLFPDPQP